MTPSCDPFQIEEKNDRHSSSLTAGHCPNKTTNKGNGAIPGNRQASGRDGIPCQASNPKHTHRESIRTTPLPAAPWTEISVDFAVPFPSGEYLLVVIDDYSRFPEVEILPSLSANVVIPALQYDLRQARISHHCQNRQWPFQWQDFKDFATQSSFRHRSITPLWPEANGEAEHFVRTLKRYILATTVEGFNWKNQLPHFLR